MKIAFGDLILGFWTEVIKRNPLGETPVCVRWSICISRPIILTGYGYLNLVGTFIFNRVVKTLSIFKIKFI